jgi:peptidoglycan hydrolase CwlO-like protein
MTQLFFQAAQSVTSAVITIIGLLLVAGIIGYLSAWFYSKSIYVPIVNKLQSEKDELIHQVEGLNRKVEVMKGEINKLNGTIDGQNAKINSLEKELEEKAREMKKVAKPVKDI